MPNLDPEDTRVYTDVEIPEERKAFLAELGCIVKQDERGLYTLWPAQVFGKACGVIPKCLNGAYYVSSQKDIDTLCSAAAAVYHVASLMKYNYELAGRI